MFGGKALSFDLLRKMDLIRSIQIFGSWKACILKFRGQYETLCAKCSSKLFDLVSSGDVRHLLEMKNMLWWGRGSLGPTDMMTPTRS
ncbi:hypothetical protein H5410_017605 [Solanum commersonii]|uniref:Uncharacterized protein n=1 Tax=Solanum commersonii TaxID=4109 RepID=A0A9J5ZZM1_SOLCO|nr:hypothetical protein H5410_017605 [Solanum commersonii]